MEKLCGIKFDGFIEVKAGLYYCELDGTPWSNKKQIGLGGRNGWRTDYINMLKPIGSINRNGYIYVGCENKMVLWHRVVYCFFNPFISIKTIDHKNNNRTDNRISNLQEISFDTNCRKCNLFKTNSSGFPGVYLYKKINKWQSYIRINDKSKHLGLYTDPIEAFKHYILAKAEYHGPSTLVPIKELIIKTFGEDYYKQITLPPIK